MSENRENRMITSIKQYKVAKEQLAMLTESLSAPVNPDIPKVLAEGAKGQLKELIAEVKANIEEYEMLKEGGVRIIKIHSMEDLMLTPIRYRVASHMSVEVFAQKVGVASRQIARYEKESYRNSNSSTLTKIIEKLDLSLSGHVA